MERGGGAGPPNEPARSARDRTGAYSLPILSVTESAKSSARFVEEFCLETGDGKQWLGKVPAIPGPKIRIWGTRLLWCISGKQKQEQPQVLRLRYASLRMTVDKVGLCYPTLATEKSRKDGARGIRARFTGRRRAVPACGFWCWILRRRPAQDCQDGDVVVLAEGYGGFGGLCGRRSARRRGSSAARS